MSSTDVEVGCYIEDPAPGPESCEQQGVTSARAQDQPRILPQFSQPLQDQIDHQDVGTITQCMSVESAPHSLPKIPDNSDDE
jgi:hypothetical protein